MKKGKSILEYCANCDEELEMPIVQRDPSNPHLIWVRCPKCNETKPVDIEQVKSELHEESEIETDEPVSVGIDETLEDEEEPEEEDLDELIAPTPPPEKKSTKKKPAKKKTGKAGKEKEPAEEQVFKINPDKARDYHPWESYQPGETVRHPKWNDYGVVLRVRRSGGGRNLIEVRFEKSGEKKLLSNQPPPAS
jgi:hypothetical protein